MTSVVNNDAKKKSGGFLGLMSDKSDRDIDMIKCTAFLCYGYAAAKADITWVPTAWGTSARLAVTDWRRYCGGRC